MVEYNILAYNNFYSSSVPRKWWKDEGKWKFSRKEFVELKKKMEKLTFFNERMNKVSECYGEEEKLNKVLKSIRDISSSISN